MNHHEPGKDTEAVIYEAAKRVFVRKGMEATKMQDIADEAHISRTALHYYFRSKKKLFDAVFEDEFGNFTARIEEILGKEHKDFRYLVESIIDNYVNTMKSNPHFPYLILTELKNNPEQVIKRIKRYYTSTQYLKEYIDKHYHPEKTGYSYQHFLLNLISMCVFPILARPLIRELILEEGESFESFMEDRKKIILDVLMKSVE